MTTAIGIICILLFNVMQGVSAVYLSSFLQKVDFFVVLFSVFAVIAIVFNAILAWNGGFRSRIDRSWWGPLALLNVTTAASWASFFYAVKHIEPALSSSFINAILPLATLCAGYVLSQRSPLKPVEIAVAGALFLAMLSTGWVAFVGRSGMSGTPVQYLIGLGMSALCGIAMSVTNVVSKKLNNIGATPEQIMAYRFLLLAFAAGALASQRELVATVSSNWLPILFVAVVGNLLPIYALQLGIQRLKPVAVAFLIGLAPILVFFMQGFSQDIAFSWPSLLTTALTTVVVLIGTYVSLVRPSAKAKVPGSQSEAVVRAEELS